MAKLAAHLIAFLLLLGSAHAFQFDHWRAGMSVREAMTVAEEKDIPIVRAGLVSTNRGFDPNVSTKHIDTAHEFYYADELIGERAKIYLTFTPESKLLSAVRIRWDNVAENSHFRNKIFGLLKSKYGNVDKKEKQLFLEKLTWTVDKSSFLSMKIGIDAILLEYLNTRAREQGRSESRLKQEESWRTSAEKDKSRF